MKKWFMVVIAVFCIQNLWNQIQREEQREKEVIVQKKVSKRDKKRQWLIFMERIRYKRIHNWHECILKDVEG